jgi:hypothetical protein
MLLVQINPTLDYKEILNKLQNQKCYRCPLSDHDAKIKILNFYKSIYVKNLVAWI